MDLIYKTSVQASSKDSIPSFYANQDFMDEILVIHPTTTTAGNLVSAGFVSQMIFLGSRNIKLNSQRLIFNEFNIFRCAKLETLEYKLFINPENWIRNIRLDVYNLDIELQDELAGKENNSLSANVISQILTNILVPNPFQIYNNSQSQELIKIQNQVKNNVKFLFNI